MLCCVYFLMFFSFQPLLCSWAGFDVSVFSLFFIPLQHFSLFLPIFNLMNKQRSNESSEIKSYSDSCDIHVSVWMRTLTVGCLSGLYLDTALWTSSHPHCCFFVSFFLSGIFSRARFSMSVSVGWCKWVRVGGVGFIIIYHHQPTQNPSLWWYKSI